MSNVQKALKAAIEWLEEMYGEEERKKALALCKAALADIEKCEPMAYTDYYRKKLTFEKTGYPLYTSPQPRDWVSVSDYAINKLVYEYSDDLQTLLHQYEFLLKQLNTKG